MPQRENLRLKVSSSQEKNIAVENLLFKTKLEKGITCTFNSTLRLLPPLILFL